MLWTVLLLIALGFPILWGSPFGTSSRFEPGDKVIFSFTKDSCPVGGAFEEFKVTSGSYECVDYKGKRWIRPFDAGLLLYKELNLKDNFSVEFNFLAFKEGCPYVAVNLFSEEGLKRAKAKNRNGVLANSYITMIGTCESLEAGIDTKPKDFNALREYSRKAPAQQVHKVALSVKNGRASLFLNGTKIAMETFRPQKPIRGISLYFYRRYATNAPYADNPALVSDLKIALYTGKKKAPPPLSKTSPPPQRPKTVVPPPRRPEPQPPQRTVARTTPEPAGARCIPSTGVGEASVIGGDRASAKAEAYARAKWDAIEKALGVTTSVKTILHNFQLLDEVIKNQVGGFIKDVRILSEENFADMVRIKIKGCVYPTQAEKALSLISSDTMFSVLVVVKNPHSVELDEMNPVTTELVNILNQQGFKVYDFTANPNVDPFVIEKIIAQRRFILLRAYMARVLSGAMVVGKVELVPSTRQGQDIGYGISSPFNVVTARLTYYLLTRDNRGMRIVASGSLSAVGRALNETDAGYKAMEALAKKLGADIMGKIDRYRAMKKKVVTVIVKGVRSTTQNFSIKEKLQRVPWVESVEDIGLGQFRVVYLDNTVYLANAIERIPELKLIRFNATEVEAELI